MSIRQKLNRLSPTQRRLLVMTMTAMMTALYFVLDRLLSFYPVPSIKIGFNFLPVAAAAVWLGPIPAAIVGGLGDLLGSLLMPAGAPIPMLTVTAAAEGLVLGLLLYEKAGKVRPWRSRWVRLAIGLLIAALLHVVVTTWALAVMFSPDAVLPWMVAKMPMRALKEGIMLVIQPFVYALLMKMA